MIVKIIACVFDIAQGGPIDRAMVRLLHSPTRALAGEIGLLILPVSPANLPDALVISCSGYADYRRAVPAMRSGSLRLGDVGLRSTGASNSNIRASKKDQDLVARCRKARDMANRP